MRVRSFLLLTLFTLHGPVRADEVLLSAYRESGCVITMLAEAGAEGLRLRTARDDGKVCQLSFEALALLIDDGLRQAQQRWPARAWRYFFLGRALEYPWLSRGLAEAAMGDARWDFERGSSTAGHPNALVAELLARPELARRLYPLFEAHGYRVAAVGVEKVLATGYREFIGEPPSTADGETCTVTATVPFDAQVWLRLTGARTPD